jgi:arylsulfatase A-like enzyme
MRSPIKTCEKRGTLSAVPEEPARLLLMAAWFGLSTGLGEVSLRAVQWFILNQRTFVSPHVVWMAPLADLLFFAISGLILFLIARRWPALVSLRIAVFIFAFLAFLGPLLWYPRLHVFAALLLAAGLSVQTARLATHINGFNTFVRRSIGWMIALVVGLAVGVSGWQVFVENRALAKLPPASPSAPNVLLIVLDTVRAQNLSLYGYPRSTTPQLERLAKIGVVFERALSTSPWTLPSHASMFTGRYPHEVSADYLTPLDAACPTMAEVLSAHGYVTAGFVANFLYCSYETGLNRGFVHYEDYPISIAMILKSSWIVRIIAERTRRDIGEADKLLRKSAAELNGDFLLWLSKKDRRPFFAFLNYMDAHGPYIAPEPFDVMFGPKRARPDPALRREWSPQEIQLEVDAYDSSIAYLDHQLGLLSDELQRRGLLENTLVIITSDHGEQFGEHGLFGHGNSLYRPLLHVPLLISFPLHVPESMRVREPVTLLNLPATVMDLIEPSSKSKFRGNSLARYWEEARRHSSPEIPLLSEVSKGINLEPWQPVTKGDMKSLVIHGMHYIKNGDGKNGDGREELYDFEKDENEEQDLAASEQGRRALGQFRLLLDTMLTYDQQHSSFSFRKDKHYDHK